jgi:hypothetical protein
MWSFVSSISVFLVLLVVLGCVQYRARKAARGESSRVDEEMQRAGQIAQRRHVLRFGKEDTGLHEALNGIVKKA